MLDIECRVWSSLYFVQCLLKLDITKLLQLDLVILEQNNRHFLSNIYLVTTYQRLDTFKTWTHTNLFLMLRLRIFYVCVTSYLIYFPDHWAHNHLSFQFLSGFLLWIHTDILKGNLFFFLVKSVPRAICYFRYGFI